MPGKSHVGGRTVQAGKRRRLRYLTRERPELLRELLRLFDVPDYDYDPEGIPDTFFEEEETGASDSYSLIDTQLHLHVPNRDDEIPF